jgi:hypothetical protein
MQSILVRKILVLLVVVISVSFITCGGSNDSQEINGGSNDSQEINGEKTTFTITFNPNGGSGGQTTSVTATYGNLMPKLAGQIPTLEAPAQPLLEAAWTNDDRLAWWYYFDGYYDEQTGGTMYYDADLSPVKDWDKKEDTTLYAQWISIAEKYSITLGLYDYAAPFAETAPIIDGKGDDPIWAKAPWRPIDQVWLGGGNASSTNLTPPPPGTYAGRFKIVWTEDRLYYLAEILDDYISTTRQDTPLVNYWEDDLLELFIDENASGGNHQQGANAYNAFAYHISFGGTNVVDVGTNGQPRLFNHHLDYRIGNRDNADGSNIYTWEVEMKVFDDTYNENITTNVPVKLNDGKMMGFAVAYCDANQTNSREYFMGSMYIPGANKNVAWQTADVFARLHLVR